MSGANRPADVPQNPRQRGASPKHTTLFGTKAVGEIGAANPRFKDFPQGALCYKSARGFRGFGTSMAIKPAQPQRENMQAALEIGKFEEVDPSDP